MPAPTTLSELIALYLARCRIEGLSPRTQHAYSETLARFQRSVAAQGAPDAAAAVETATVIRYCETFQARRPATRHRYFREVRCFFNWCVAAGFLDHTPFRGLRNVRLPSEVVQPFRPPELARLVGACDPATAVGRCDAAVVLLFLDTGIRCAELSALDLADCDLPRGRLLIRHGKGNKQRVVPFARRCRAALEAYLAVRGPTPGPLVWAVTGPGQLRPGVRLQPNGLKQLLRRRGRAAHVPRCHAPPLSPYLRDLGHPAGRPRTRRPALARPRRPRDGAPLHRQLPRRGRRPPPRALLACRSDAQGIRVRRTRAPLAPPLSLCWP